MLNLITKMKLNFAIICDNAFADNAGRLTIVQTYDQININKDKEQDGELTVIHPRLALVTNFTLEKDEFNKDHIQTSTIYDPNKNQIVQIRTSFNNETSRPKSQIIHYFNNIIFRKTGLYTIEIQVDKGKLIDTNLPLTVKFISTA